MRDRILTRDEVIREIGARLRASVRLADAATRRGGDEFGILLAEVDSNAAALAVAERIYATICQSMEIEGRQVRVGASIGLYVVQPGQTIPSIARLHDLCDKLMYWAKFHGGGIRSNVVQAESRWSASAPEDDPAVA